MKKFYLLFLGISVSQLSAQGVFFAENFGDADGTTAISAHTFQNGSPVFFSGTADVRVSTPSDYDGASGDACVFFGGTSPEKNLVIEGIDTSDFSDITMSFGQQKGTNASSNELLVSVSSDGINYTPLTYTRPTGGGTSIWIEITPSGTIPSTENLRIKFVNPISNVGFRIDDVKLSGNVLGVNKNSIEGLNIFPNPVAGDFVYIKSDLNATKEVVIYDVLGKQVQRTSTESAINISSLNSGIYVVKITENGKFATRKLVVK